MANYRRLTRKNTISWQPGEYGNLTTIKCFKTIDPTISPEQGTFIENNNYVGQYQPGVGNQGGRWLDLSWISEFRGSDTADVPPPEAPLLRACAFEETSSGTTPSTVYAYELKDPHLITDTPAGDLDPIDITHNIDLLNRVAENCVGNAVFNFTAGMLPTVAFTFRGNCATSPAATETAASSFYPGSLPVPVRGEGLTITPAGGAAYTPVLKSLTYDCGNIIDPRDDVNGNQGYSGPIITGRNPRITCIVETDLIANVNWETIYTARTRLDFAFTHNDGGGIREECAVAFSGELVGYPQIVDVNGTACYQLNMTQSVAAAATALTLTWASS